MDSLSKMIKTTCKNCFSDIYTYPSVNKECCSRKCSVEYKKKQRWERLKRECAVCGSEFIPKHPKSPGVYCSHSCRGKASRKNRVERNGYWHVCVPEHPAATSQGYVPEQVLIVENSLGRKLSPDEVVHHINHDKKDNRIENLMVMLDSDHRAHHMAQLRREGRINTASQRRRASVRMRKYNSSIEHKRGDDGRFIRSF